MRILQMWMENKKVMFDREWRVSEVEEGRKSINFPATLSTSLHVVDVRKMFVWLDKKCIVGRVGTRDVRMLYKEENMVGGKRCEKKYLSRVGGSGGKV